MTHFYWSCFIYSKLFQHKSNLYIFPERNSIWDFLYEQASSKINNNKKKQISRASKYCTVYIKYLEGSPNDSSSPVLDISKLPAKNVCFCSPLLQRKAEQLELPKEVISEGGEASDDPGDTNETRDTFRGSDIKGALSLDPRL